MNPRLLLIGGSLCHRVAAASASSTSLYGLRRNPPADATIDWIRADITDPDSLKNLPAGLTHVLYAPAPDSRHETSYQAVYPVGLQNILNALSNQTQLKRLVLVSSTVVWRSADIDTADDWVDETTPAHPENFRGELILEAERLLQEHLPSCGTILRLGGIYGRGPSRLLDRIQSGSLIAPDGPGHWSNRIHIDDAASACLHLLNLAQSASCYIGTDGWPRDKATFYDELADLIGVDRPRRQAMPPTGKRLSNARLCASGWQPKRPDAMEEYCFSSPYHGAIKCEDDK